MSTPSDPVPPLVALPRRPSPAPHRRASVLATVLLAAMLLVVVSLPGLAQADQAEGVRWRWPLPSPHHVISPFQAPEHRYGPGHRGIDIAVGADGATVRAVEAGTVRFSGMVAGRGVVSVTHADGLISTYEPVDGVLTEGSPVEAGQVLGILAHVSASSHCPGSICLHLGARREARYLDPLLLLGARGPSVLLPWGGPSGGAAGPAPATAAGPVQPAMGRVTRAVLVGAARSTRAGTTGAAEGSGRGAVRASIR